MGWGCSSVAQRLPGMCKVLNSIPATKRKKKMGKDRELPFLCGRSPGTEILAATAGHDGGRSGLSQGMWVASQSRTDPPAELAAERSCCADTLIFNQGDSSGTSDPLALCGRDKCVALSSSLWQFGPAALGCSHSRPCDFSLPPHPHLQSGCRGGYPTYSGAGCAHGPAVCPVWDPGLPWP